MFSFYGLRVKMSSFLVMDIW